MHTRASNSVLVEPLPEPERTLNRRLRRRNKRVPYDQRNNLPQNPRIVYPPILNINYFCNFLDILQNYDPMDDEPMWAVDHVVAPNPGSAITIPKTANEFAIKGNHLTLVKGNQFDGRTKTDPHKHIHEFLGICDIKITQEVLNATAGGIFLYKTPNQAYQLLEDIVLLKLDWAKNQKTKSSLKKTIAFADEGSSNFDTDKIIARMDAMTLKMDAQYKELQSNVKKTKPDLDEDDIPMSHEEEAKFMQTFRKTRFTIITVTEIRIAIIGVQMDRMIITETTTDPISMINPKNHQASIQNLETKFDRLADKQSGRPSGSLPTGMPNYGNFLKELISNKHKIEQISAAFLSDESSAMIQNKVPPKLRDPGSFHIPCNFNKTFSCNALADLGASINLILYSLYAKLSLETLKPTKISVRFADRSFQYTVGIAENMLVEVGKFTFPVDFVILEMEEDSKVPLILRRPFLHTADAVIRVKQNQLNLRVGTERMIFNIDSAMKHSYLNNDTCFSIDVIDEILEEDFDALLDACSKILHSIEGTLLEEEIFAEFDEFIAMTADENSDSESDTEEPPFEKITINTNYKSKHLSKNLLWISNLNPFLIIWNMYSWKNPIFFLLSYHLSFRKKRKTNLYPFSKSTRKILLGKQQTFLEVVKKEIMKLLDTGIIYPIADSPWVSPIYCVPKKGGITVVTNENDELVLTRTVTGWRVYIDYRKLNEATAKDHFPLPFMDKLLERLIGNKYFCFLDGFSRYFQIPIDPNDQEKTTFTCPFETYLYRRMPFGLCNAPATFQSAGLEVNKAKINDFSKIVRPLTKLLEKDTSFEFDDECQKAFELLKEKLTCALVIVSPNWNLPFELMCDASDFAVGAVLGQKDGSLEDIPRLSLETLKPTKMSVRLADRSFQYLVGIAENMLVEDEEDFDALLDEGSKILYSIKGTLLEEEIFVEFDEFIAMTADENSDSEFDTEEPPFEKITINTDYKIKTSLEEPPTDLELKPLLDNLEYVFQEEPSFLPVIISSQLSKEKKNKLVSILKNHKQAFSWKTTDIPGICPSFCKHKIQLLDDKKPVIQKQRRFNLNMHEVVKKEIMKLLDTSIIYPIPDSPWVSPIHCVPKKGGITVVTNENGELVLTRIVTGWRVCIDYRKLNKATVKDHFPLLFMDQMLERLTGNKYFCFLDGFSRYFQIPIDSNDQEKTTFTCPFGNNNNALYTNVPLWFNLMLLATFQSTNCKDAQLVLKAEIVTSKGKEGIMLGHKVSCAGLEVDKAKIDIILKLPPPANIKGIRSFLGNAGFY
ncbi:reverse transcriptase domain-containing protein [Tanacetum coccineum]